MFNSFKNSTCSISSTQSIAKPPPFFQPKLSVNTPGDAHEQEADQVADQVMRMRQGDAPIVQRMPITPVSSVQRACANCAHEKEKEGVQRKETGGGDAGGKAAPSIVSDVLSSGGGQPMDGSTKQFMESRFGQDFSQVRIHTDSRAAESANAIQARAYTSGRDVVFGQGEYQPESENGKRLLAHELVHVGQQGGGEHAVQRTPWYEEAWDATTDAVSDAASTAGDAMLGAAEAIVEIPIEAGRQVYDMGGLATQIVGQETGLFDYEHEVASQIGHAAEQGQGTGDILMGMGRGIVETPERLLDAASSGDARAFGRESMNLYMIGRSAPAVLRGGVRAVRAIPRAAAGIARGTARGAAAIPGALRSGARMVRQLPRNAARASRRIAGRLIRGFGRLPEGASVVQRGRYFVIYRTAAGQMRIRFKARVARTLREANPGRNMTTDNLAGVNGRGEPFVFEGRHRAIGAAHGDAIPADLGGVPDAPGVLDFEYSSNPAPNGGPRVTDLTIDYTVPEAATAAEADQAWSQRHGIKND